LILAVINNKGGTGKTTTSVNIAAGLAREGFRTLLVDLDSQASAALSLGIPRSALEPSMADALLDGLPLEEAVRPSSEERLDLCPGHMDLAHTDLTLADTRGREKRLSLQLSRVRQSYDCIVLDCPPSLSMLSVNGLFAADSYLIPVKPEYLSLEGLANLDAALTRMKAGMNTAPKLLGILLTIVHPCSRAARQNMHRIRDQYGEAVFESYIRQDVRLFEAPANGESIYTYAPRSTGALAYKKATQELVKRLRQDGAILNQTAKEKGL
jgi:chromosome partitioning protein